MYDNGIHVTYVNGQIDDGSAVAGLMRYFKTADPKDMSQGALSDRVHFLKCEDGGYELMKDGLEKLCDMVRTEGKREGLREGEMKAKKEMAVNLSRMGMPVDDIAKAIPAGLEVVQQWLAGIAAVRP